MSRIKDLLKALIFLAIGSIVLFLVFRSNQAAYLEECQQSGILAKDCSLLKKIASDFSEVKIFWIAIVLFCFILSNWSRARRWHLVLNPLGYFPKMSNSFLSIMLAYFTNLGIPRSGEFVRAGTLSKYENIPFETLMGTIVLDRIIDVICLMAVIALAFVFEFDVFYNYLSENNVLGGDRALISNQMLLMLVVGGIVFTGLAWMIRQRIKETAIYKKIVKIVRGFLQGLLSIRKVERRAEFIFHSIFIWVMYFLMTYLCFFAYDPTALLDAGAGLVTFLFGALGIVFPSPGGMGSYHYLVSEALQLYGVAKVNSFSFAMIAFVSIQLFCNILFGIIALIGLPILNKKKA